MKKDDRFIELIKKAMKTIVIYLIVIIVLTQFVIRPFRVDGESMMPTVHSGELGISNVLGTKLGSINRFDVVIVYSEASSKYIFKRVIGLPNETIQYDNDMLYIDGKVTEEPFLDKEYIKQMTDNGNLDFSKDFGPLQLGKDEYFLVGDNRMRSHDSRDVGAFHKSQIKSKNGIIFFPLNRMRFLGGK